MGHSMAKVERVLIVVGGIAGLTAAIALRQHEFIPTVMRVDRCGPIFAFQWM
jgi:hypothetical protein